jgi:hypothetical protein
VDVGSATGIGNGPYRAEVISARGIADGATTPLEPLIPAAGSTAIPRVPIHTIGIALPDLYARSHEHLRRAV